MSLDLDKRQRAMLREMGVRVWQPMAVPVVAPVAAAQAVALADAPRALPVHSPVAIDSVAGDARSAAATGTFSPKTVPQTIRAPDVVADNAAAAGGWDMGEALALYEGAAADGGARWLVLVEAPASALQPGAFSPFEGDAGKLLDNMLRAAGLHKAGTALLAPLARRGAADANLPVSLPALLESARPDVVLVMGRLVAQSLLKSTEPFGKLRGQVHALHGFKTIVTHDAPYLLRTPLDKAKAWEDLCLALHTLAEK